MLKISKNKRMQDDLACQEKKNKNICNKHTFSAQQNLNTLSIRYHWSYQITLHKKPRSYSGFTTAKG